MPNLDPTTPLPTGVAPPPAVSAPSLSAPSRHVRDDGRDAEGDVRDDAAVEASLLCRVGDGDPSAVADVVTRFGPMVMGLARRWSSDAMDAEDAVQDVFFDLWRSCARFDPAKASARGFVAMLARRRLIDRARKRARAPEFEAFPDGFDVVDDSRPEPEQAFRVEQARQVLQQLTPPQRRLLELSLLEGQTHDEIARQTGMPLGTVKSHLRRGLQRARALLAGARADGEEA